MKLDSVVPWGRSFEEYRRMFALTDDDLAGPILGCGDGPASFNAEATSLGYDIVSCDPIYSLSGSEIRQRVADCYPTIIEQVRANRESFVWDFFRDPDQLGECRLATMRMFVEDFDRGTREGRYVAASLPELPFTDSRFRLAVVSHFLFLYSALFDAAFHLAAIRELLRVAREARIFPLLTLERTWSPHVEPVCRELRAEGFAAEIVVVGYEFQRNEEGAGNRMLRVSQNG